MSDLKSAERPDVVFDYMPEKPDENYQIRRCRRRRKDVNSNMRKQPNIFDRRKCCGKRPQKPTTKDSGNKCSAVSGYESHWLVSLLGHRRREFILAAQIEALLGPLGSPVGLQLARINTGHPMVNEKEQKNRPALQIQARSA
ncbi:hypothetical protein DFH09DRAFT_1079868 [Mycena vulgaris]|nr:hypothetical protein DFH09DRAFT_1079868 [Mycena vulgaris]